MGILILLQRKAELCWSYGHTTMTRLFAQTVRPVQSVGHTSLIITRRSTKPTLVKIFSYQSLLLHHHHEPVLGQSHVYTYAKKLMTNSWKRLHYNTKANETLIRHSGFLLSQPVLRVAWYIKMFFKTHLLPPSSLSLASLLLFCFLWDFFFDDDELGFLLWVAFLDFGES